MNLLEFFAGARSWRQFYNLIARLPHWGHYKAALAMDEVWANRMLDREEAGLDAPPTGGDGETADLTPLGYSDIVARLDLIADRVFSVRTAVQATITKDHEEPRFPSMPRPVTAIERERERRARTVLLEVDALVMGGGAAIT